MSIAADPMAPVAPVLSRRAVWIGGACLATAAVATAVTPRQRGELLQHTRLADVLPHKVGAWVDGEQGGLVLPETPAPDEFYDQVFTHTFVAAGKAAIMVVIAYGAAQSGLMKVHRPEVCFGSAGFKVSGDAPDRIEIGTAFRLPAKRFTATRDQRVEQVLYWTRIAGQFPTDLLDQRLIMLEEGLRGRVPDGVLVRMSTLGTDVAASQALLHQFAAALVQASDPSARAILLGPASSAALGKA